MGKFTKDIDSGRRKFTTKLSSPFTVAFRQKLRNGYTFADLKPDDLKAWQNFLDIASQLSFQQVEARYRRISDTNDTFEGEQVIHYGISDTFRIHGIIEGAVFLVIRTDPRHKFHGKRRKH